MLQENNNNNHPCLDMGHKEMLHGRRYSTTPFSSALELGAIPLIKGLRAWAINGGYSRSRRKAAPQAPPDGRAGQRSWVSQVASGHRKTENSIASFQTPGARQGGLGALVTVATLKGTEGNRQTQTRCLFLKAEGCSYLCTVSNRAAGTRGVGQRAHINLVDGKESTLGRRRNKDNVEAFEVKPKVLPKWRKSSKVTRPIGKGLAAESKGSVVFSSIEEESLDKRDPFTMQLNKQKEASTGTPAIMHCLSIPSGLANHNNLANDNESFNYDMAHLSISEPFPTPENFAHDKANSSLGEHGLGPKPSKCEVHTGHEMPCPCHKGTDEATDTIQHKNDLSSDVKCKGTNFVSGVPKFKEVSSGAYARMLMRVTNNRNGDAEEKQKRYSPHDQGCVVPKTRNSSDSTEEEQKGTRKHRIDIDSLHCENEKHKVTIDTGPTEKDEALDLGSTTHQGADAGQYHVPAGVGAEVKEDQWCSPACCSWHLEDIDKEYETPVEKFPKSASRGSIFSKVAVAAAATSMINPAHSTTANDAGAIATTFLAVSKQEAAGAKIGNVGLQLGSELLAEQEMGQGEDMVATKERPTVTGQEEEDDFGVFVQAGEEQIWAEGFNELQQVPCRKHDCVEYTNPFDANEHISWTSNWSGIQPSQPSVDSWSSFKQESREQEQEMEMEMEMAPWVHWGSSKAMDSTHLTSSSLHNLHRVFLEAFPCAEPPCGESDCIPTLNELLWGPALKNTVRKTGNLMPWDGLQDLDRMIDVKYKGVESMSHRFLLQSLHLGIPNSEQVHRRKQAIARFSPNLPTSSQKLAAKAKRRLSYDINRNIVA